MAPLSGELGEPGLEQLAMGVVVHERGINAEEVAGLEGLRMDSRE